jgi:hypothetical protein
MPRHAGVWESRLEAGSREWCHTPMQQSRPLRSGNDEGAYL